jgi:hypothetical protein
MTMPDYRIAIVRPSKLHEQFSQELRDKAEWPIELIIDATRNDIDIGASGYVMLDKDFHPTGAPPPDPEGALCVVCRARIRAHDNNTAFALELGFKDDGDIEVGGGGCCEKCSQLSDDELLAKVCK